MQHKPIQIKQLNLLLPHKTCFEDFNIQVHAGDRIGIIGVNGSGKSTLLKKISGQFSSPYLQGEVRVPENVVMGYVPQVIEECATLSGGERFHFLLARELAKNPNVLLLDEPSNHLDWEHYKALIKDLVAFEGTLLMISHDVNLLRECVNTFWVIENNRIQIFSGGIDDYLTQQSLEQNRIAHEISILHREKKFMHESLMKEQVRAKKSREKGEKSIYNRKWPTITSTAKARRAEKSSGRKKNQIEHKKSQLLEQLSQLKINKKIMPRFSLNTKYQSPRELIYILDGSISFDFQTIIEHINFSLFSRDRIALMGSNGVGKTSFVKAILNQPGITKKGQWQIIHHEQIGYLDQHYMNLCERKSVYETIAEMNPAWNSSDVRRFLSDFLFFTNEEVNMSCAYLSGGEKARLSLAQIAAKTPSLLILDEITNNLDLETKQHVIDVLSVFPGALLIISHDADFLNKIGIEERYLINHQKLVKCHQSF